MSKKFVLITLILCVFIFLFTCQAAVQAQNADDYNSLVKKLKNGDTKIDYKELRLSYTKTKNYDPYDNKNDDSDKMHQALSQGNFEEAAKYSNKILDKNYTDIDAHVMIAHSYRKLGNTQKADFHRDIARGLMLSILKSGDGKTPQTAMKVISVAEEYSIFKALNLEPRGQKLIEKNGHKYDQMTIFDKETDKETDVYFNIDIPMNWMMNKLMKSSKTKTTK